MKKIIMILVTLSLLFSCVQIPVLAADDGIKFNGYQDSLLAGGTFDRLHTTQFRDLFESDGSTGTNGTIKVNGSQGLKAEQTESSLKFLTNGAVEVKRQRVKLLDKSYSVSYLDKNLQYYIELPIKASIGGELTVSFEDQQGKAAFQITKAPDQSAQWEIKAGEQSIGTMAYGEATDIGVLLHPVAGLFAVSTGGQPVLDQPAAFQDGVGAITAVRFIWHSSAKYWNLGESVTESLELSTLTLYQEREKEVTEINLSGIQNNSDFSGGIFHLKSRINFTDLYKEGEANGLVSFDKMPLVVKKTNLGIGYWRNPATEGAGGSRGKAIMDVTYPLTDLSGADKPYYIEVSLEQVIGGALEITFGSGDGVVKVRKRDGYTGTDGVGSPEGPEGLDYKTGGTTRETAQAYKQGNMKIGVYVNPGLKQMAFYYNGEKLSDNVYAFPDGKTGLDSIRFTWYGSIRWWAVNASEHLLLQNLKVFEPGKAIEEIGTVIVKDQTGTEITALDETVTGVNVSARVLNTSAEKMYLYVAYYGNESLLKVERTEMNIASGKAAAELSLQFKKAAAAGERVKIFCWKDDILPVTNHKSVQMEYSFAAAGQEI